MSENKNIINEQEPQDDHMIEGRNAVLEAFRAGKTIDKLYIQDGLLPKEDQQLPFTRHVVGTLEHFHFI